MLSDFVLPNVPRRPNNLSNLPDPSNPSNTRALLLQGLMVASFPVLRPQG